MEPSRTDSSGSLCHCELKGEPLRMTKKSKKSENGYIPRASDLKKGKYADRSPLDDVKYLECKLILKGDRFTTESNFDDFGKIVKGAAEAADVGFSRKPFKDALILGETRDLVLIESRYRTHRITQEAGKIVRTTM